MSFLSVLTRGKGENDSIEEWEDAVCDEIAPFRHGSGHNGSCCRRKRQLEDVGRKSFTHGRLAGIQEESAES